MTRMVITGMDEAIKKAEAIEKALQPDRIDGVVERAAQETRKFMVFVTPNKATAKWPATATGAAAASWTVETPKTGSRIVTPNSEGAKRVIVFLSYGTRAHGPVKAKALFIPLTMKAKTAYLMGGTFRKSFAVRAFTSRGFTTTKAGKTKKLGEYGKRSTVQVRGAGDRSGGAKLVYGVDYVLAKWVRGITASNIIPMGQEFADERLGELATDYIQKVIRR